MQSQKLGEKSYSACTFDSASDVSLIAEGVVGEKSLAIQGRLIPVGAILRLQFCSGLVRDPEGRRLHGKAQPTVTSNIFELLMESIR